MPSKCSIKYFLAVLLCQVIRWNLDREIQFSRQWAYVPISPKDFITTQWLSLPQGQRNIDRSSEEENGIFSMFHLVQMGLEEEESIFGLTSAFKEEIEELPTPLISQEDKLLTASECVIELAFTESKTLDPILERLLNETVQIYEGMETVEVQEVEGSLETILNEDDYARNEINEAQTTVSAIQMPRKRNRSHVPNTHQTGSASHKRQGIIAQLGSRRFGPSATMDLWEEVFSSIGEAFNPLERRLLRFIALKIEGDNVSHLKEIDIRRCPWGLMHRVWSVLVSCLRSSEMEFAKYIKIKSTGCLKKELEWMHAMDTYNWNLEDKSRSKTIMNKLLDLVRTLPIKELDSQNAQGGSTSHFQNVAELGDGDEIEEHIEEFPPSTAHPRSTTHASGQFHHGVVSTCPLLTDKDLIQIAENRRTANGRMNWERTIFPEWRRLNVSESHCVYLRRHMENEAQKNKKNKNPSMLGDLGIVSETSPSQLTDLIDQSMSHQIEHSLPALMESQVNDDALLSTIPSESRLVHNEVIEDEDQIQGLPRPGVGQPFTPAENDLFNHLMTDETAQKKIRTAIRGRKKLICWKTVEKMWIEESTRRNHESEDETHQLYFRTAKQLKERLKDM